MTIQEMLDRQVISESLRRLFHGQFFTGKAVVIGAASEDHVVIHVANLPIDNTSLTSRFLYTGRPYEWAMLRDGTIIVEPMISAGKVA